MFQPVEYERIPKYCTACFKQGHDNSSCNTLTPSQPEQRTVVVVPQPSTTAPTTTQPSRRRRSRSWVRRQREGKGIAIDDAELVLAMSNTFDALGDMPVDSHEVCGLNNAASSIPSNSVRREDDECSSQTSDGSTGDHFEDPTDIARDLAARGLSRARQAPTTKGKTAKNARKATEHKTGIPAPRRDVLSKLRILLKLHTPVLLGILEPMKAPSQIDYYRTLLGFTGAKCGANDQIWLFWNFDIAPSIHFISHFAQSLTFSFSHPSFPNPLWLSVVYAKCKYRDREPLWEYLRETHAALPADMAWGWWVISTVCSIPRRRKEAGRMLQSNIGLLLNVWRIVNWLILLLLGRIIPGSTTEWAAWRFGAGLTDCCLTSRGWICSLVWCITWIELDLIMLLCWWSVSLMNVLLHGLSLSLMLKVLEQDVRDIELQLQTDSSDETYIEFKRRSALLKHQYRIEDDFWRQKAHAKWVTDGERNSGYFHSVVKNRRRKLYIHRIQDDHGQWVTERAAIATQAITFFQAMFTADPSVTASALDMIPRLVIDDDNAHQCAVPEMEEVKTAVFAMDSRSAAGPDGFTGAFYKAAWTIICMDLLAMPRDAPHIHHLAYADDIVIFTSARGDTLERVRAVLHSYEQISGQAVSFPKGAFYMHPKALAPVLERVRDTLGCSLDVLPFTYLGCPIYHGRKRIHYFEPVLKKMRDKTQDTIWTAFMRAKYCSRVHPVSKQRVNADSHTWKRMLDVRAVVEPVIRWRVLSGTSNFWWDTWSGLGALHRQVDGCSGYWTDGVGDMYRSDFMIDHDALPPDLLRQLRLEPPSLVSDHVDIPALPLRGLRLRE
ncbi:unnamed protein product [Cuscuta campestris]|uniref:Reverse transcriptase domain-containing protein n=1 Tax=Cuscuta campestris TaxID=132261 RepID=A0A484ME01_9ASTE|nr:unnamed protein product [Cuscuta campestris]